MKPILDACCGARACWFDKETPGVIYADKRQGEYALCDGRTLKVKPDIVADFRAMPFKDEQFRLVLFDPPHLLKAGKKSWLAKKYGVLNRETWQDDLRCGFAECFRVLDPSGFLVFKWNEEHIGTAQVLPLAGKAPLFGHRRGKTIFLIFAKEGGGHE